MHRATWTYGGTAVCNWCDREHSSNVSCAVAGSWKPRLKKPSPMTHLLLVQANNMQNYATHWFYKWANNHLIRYSLSLASLDGFLKLHKSTLTKESLEHIDYILDYYYIPHFKKQRPKKN